jgi:hypothetical protein
MKIYRLLMIAVAISLLLTSCEKSKGDLNSEDFNLADDDAVAEAMFDDIFSSADNATQLLDNMEKSLDVTKGGIVFLVSDSCPSVSVEPVDETVRIITIDYGEGCTGFYGQTRSGRIVITVDGRRRVTGSSRTIEFDNYFFNGIKVEGTDIITNEGENDNGNVVFSHTLEGGRLIFPDEVVTGRSFYREREWIAGFDTFNPWDDESLITGTATGTNYRGVSYQNEIISSLHWKRICPFFVSGTIRITRDGAEPFELDYGDGECDELATVTRGDEVKEIILKKRHRKLR